MEPQIDYHKPELLDAAVWVAESLEHANRLWIDASKMWGEWVKEQSPTTSWNNHWYKVVPHT